MHEHRDETVRYLVVTTGKGTWEAADVEEAFDALSGIYDDGLWDAVRVEGWEGERLRPRARVETVDGAPVDVATLRAVARERHDAWLARVCSGPRRFAFRDGPVEGIGRRATGGWTRVPRHKGDRVGRDVGTAEMAEAGLAAKARGGSSGGPPDAFDDVRRRAERCWKTQRATRWKEAR